MKTMQKTTVQAFTLLEMMVVMSLMGIMIIFGNQVFRSMNLFKTNYQTRIDFSYEASQLVDQLSKDFFAAYEANYDEESSRITLLGQFGDPMMSYRVLPSALIRENEDSQQKITCSGQIHEVGNKEGIILKDMIEKVQYSFLLPPRSVVR